jgi:hypothetical protein
MTKSVMPFAHEGLPEALLTYLDHTSAGVSLRAIARQKGWHASKVMRQIRRYESRRDDPLLDEAIALLAVAVGGPILSSGGADQPGLRMRLPEDMIENHAVTGKDQSKMSAPMRHSPSPLIPLSNSRRAKGKCLDDQPPTPEPFDEALIMREALRVLRRLAEAGAVLAVANDMEKAVVLRQFDDGHNLRTAVVDRRIAQAFVLRDWISCRKPGRIASYDLTAVGRSALKRMIDADEAAQPASTGGGSEGSASGYADQHREWATRTVHEHDGALRTVRYNLAESPVAVLGRRRDKDGRPFLEPELLQAAERLREDFELAQIGPRVAQNWDRFLTGGAERSGFRAGTGQNEGASRARDRVGAALRDLGPGLGDVALRVCCFLEGVETAERRMGWAARSGKIVLRIALMRLRRHYDETYGRSGPLIG